MKYVALILSFIIINSSNAGDFNGNVLISTTKPSVEDFQPTLPFAGQKSNAWILNPYVDSDNDSLDCGIPLNTHVTYDGNNINVFLQFEAAICPPILPISFNYIPTENLKAFAAGTYSLNYYRVASVFPFPPEEDDYPDFYEGTYPIEISAANIIDSSSALSLISLMLIIAMVSMVKFHKKHREDS